MDGTTLRVPDTAENEYKEEHYRRIAYTNERFASGIPGWKTDRGRIYISAIGTCLIIPAIFHAFGIFLGASQRSLRGDW